MRTMRDIVRGYAGIRFTRVQWLHTFREDARILRNMGRHHEARLLDALARHYAGLIISEGCGS